MSAWDEFRQLNDDLLTENERLKHALAKAKIALGEARELVDYAMDTLSDAPKARD